MIPKEIREKIELKLKIDKEIKEWLSENSCVQYGEIFWECAEIVDKPQGTEQDNGEYCSQIEILNFEISMFKSFIESLEYAKTGERK